jgi:hypothetical protein
MDQRGNGSSRQIKHVVGCQMERSPPSRQSGQSGHFARTDQAKPASMALGPAMAM